MVEARKNADDWAEAALEAFASGGVRAASIPEIARSLGVTKGSFYWHFRSLDELIAAALKRWEERDRAALDELRAIADPRKRLAALFAEAMQAPQAHALLTALSGSSVPAVSSSIRRVSERRIRFLADAYVELGLGDDDARERALLVYAAYVGLIHLRGESSALRTPKQIDAIVARAIATLVPGRAAVSRGRRREKP